MIREVRILAILAFLMAPLGAFAAPTLIVDRATEQLIGATGVSIGGELFNVTFVNALCTDEFGGCDEIMDFDFQTEAEALLASQALLDQVFLGVFDDDPLLTAGCANPEVCVVVTPYGPGAPGFFLAANANNWQPPSVDDTSTEAWLLEFVAEGANEILARWAPSSQASEIPSQVPEPGTLGLLGLGLAGIGFARRRRKT